MNTSDFLEISPRNNRKFKFLFFDGSANKWTEFFPGAGARLHFASKSVDTLTLTDIPQGLLQPKSVVAVMYGNRGIFWGWVKSVIEKYSGGDKCVADVTVTGPWEALQRFVYAQAWLKPNSDFFYTSHVILNQGIDGSHITIGEQLREILEFAEGTEAFTIPDDAIVGDVFNTRLPFEETRDITGAAAILKILRYFPQIIVRFDYSRGRPEIRIEKPSPTDAAYIANIPKVDRQKEYNDGPISSVCLYWQDDFVADQGARSGCQVYPDDIDIYTCDCLKVFIPLEAPSSTVSYANFISEGEVIGQNYQSIDWWRQRHPRLSHLPNNANVEMQGNASRSDNTYNYIANETSEDIAAAGLHSAICRFKCVVRITNRDEVEDNVILTMDYLTTDAKPGKRYTWQTGSSYTEGESLPPGLAEEIYKQRSGALKNETITMLITDNVFPKLGDACDGLYLQEFDIDCDTGYAYLHFGQPEYLSIDDMRALLSDFRGRSYASNSVERKYSSQGGKSNEFDQAIKPLASTEFCPGKKIRAVVGDGTPISGNAKIKLDPTMISGGGTMAPHKLTIKDSPELTDLYIMATQDVEIPKCKAEEQTPSSGGGGVSSVKIHGTSGGVAEGDEFTFTSDYVEQPDGSKPKRCDFAVNATNKTITVKPRIVLQGNTQDGSGILSDGFTFVESEDSNVKVHVLNNTDIRIEVYYK